MSLPDQMNGRVLLGLGEFLPAGMNQSMVLQQAAPMRDTGTPIQRLAYITLVSSLNSPEAAIEALERLNQEVDEGLLDPLPAGFDSLRAIVGELLFHLASDEPDVTLPEDEREMLFRGLGVYGELLYADASGDLEFRQSLRSQFSRAAITVMFVMLWFLVMGGSGFILLILMFVLRLTKKLDFAFSTGAGAGSVYIETFAIWLFLFMAISFLGSIGLSVLYSGFGFDEYMAFEEFSGGATPLALGLATMFLSLGALAWPVIRGVRFTTMCNDIGLVWGRPFREILAGFATYAMALPILLAGALIYVVLSFIVVAIAGEQPQPSHPIQDAFSSGPISLVLMYVLACVAAPIVEEIVFGRSLPFLREMSRAWRWFRVRDDRPRLERDLRGDPPPGGAVRPGTRRACGRLLHRA